MSWLNRLHQFDEMVVTYEPDTRILWQRMKPNNRPSVTPGLVRDLTSVMHLVRDAFAETAVNDEPPIRYMVLGSALPGIFSMGGDLPMLVRLIQDQDGDTLRRYAHGCIDIIHGHANNLGLPIHTIALVQGEALGGGFEGALAQDVIVAERSAKFGLPEILFNLFPGMGAYTLLARRLDPLRAEKLITSGKVYSAEELHEIGLVDIVAEDGEGVDAIHAYIKRYERRYTAHQAIMRARKIVRPVSHQELLDITNVWVETALSLAPADLRKMERLAGAQDRRLGQVESDETRTAASMAHPA